MHLDCCMNMYQWLEDICKADQKKPLPILSFPAVQMVEEGIEELVKDAKVQAKTLRALIDRYDMPATVMFMDLSVEAEAFGSPVKFSDDDVPTVTGPILSDDADIDTLEIPKMGTARTQVFVDAVAETKKCIPDRPVIAGAAGPFTLAGRLFDMTEAMIRAMTEPESVKKVLDKITAFLIDYIRALKAAGADGVCIAEPAAGLLSPDLNAEFSVPYNKQINDVVQDENFIVIYHNCGNIDPLIGDILTIGAKALHFGNETVMEDIMQAIPSDVVVMGNIDPAVEFRNGTPQSIGDATRGLLEKCCKFPNFVLSSGCDIPLQAPLENIDAFFDTARAFWTLKAAVRSA